ncbi:MAG TPA: thiamine pyrophosphate-binding protein [Gemmatimonadales bacterium]|nr:thiamine pyrophosphate-binding protein [Gemmatimonadales bacterium]
MTGPLHGGDRVAEVLQAHGVRFLFTLCGGHISPILTGARRLGIRVVDVRDEATAVFAADAVARLTGVPGVAAVTAGPGVTNALTAVRNARLAQSPLILLGGAPPTALRRRGALQDIDQIAAVAPHVKRTFAVRRVRDLAPLLERAMSVARAGVPGPVFVECPVDLLYPETTVREWYGAASGAGRTLGERLLARYLRAHAARLFAGAGAAPRPAPAPPAPPEPDRGRVARAAALLARAERPVLLVGSQALALPEQAPRIAEAIRGLGVPGYLSGMARGLLGPDHPLQRRHQRRAALREADCVILAGVPCDFRLDYGRPIRRGATLIAANRSRREARLNRRPTLTIEGDAGLFLCRLAEAAPPEAPGRDAWAARLRARDLEREAEIEREAAAPAQFVHPLRLCQEIERAAGEEAVLVADGGDFVATASYVVRPRAPLSWLDPGVFGTLGVGAGFGLGARLCRPEAEVWILFGDGAAGFSLAEFDSFARHGIPVIAVVGNDGGWTQIAREQVKLLHDDVATVLGRAAYHEVVRGFEAEGLLVRTAAELGPALARARAAAREGRPVLVNVWIDRTGFRDGSLSM